jgi:hypothetical protein
MLVRLRLGHRNTVGMHRVLVLRMLGAGHRSAGASLRRRVMIGAIRRRPHGRDTLHEQCIAEDAMPENSLPIHASKYRLNV